nr:helix-turn-helix domain-containing protein [Pararhizobium antarcticum]
MSGGSRSGGGSEGGLPARLLCGIVRQVTAEMLMLVGDHRMQMRRDRRRSSCHVRQIAMYVSHVVLQISLTDIGQVFGRDRTTVSHACNVVEDRRDDVAFDDFVAAVERVITAVFGAGGGSDHA